VADVFVGFVHIRSPGMQRYQDRGRGHRSLNVELEEASEVAETVVAFGSGQASFSQPIVLRTGDEFRRPVDHHYGFAGIDESAGHVSLSTGRRIILNSTKPFRRPIL
jgi:hypothetical protein